MQVVLCHSNAPISAVFHHDIMSSSFSLFSSPSFPRLIFASVSSSLSISFSFPESFWKPTSHTLWMWWRCQLYRVSCSIHRTLTLTLTVHGTDGTLSMQNCTLIVSASLPPTLHSSTLPSPSFLFLFLSHFSFQTCNRRMVWVKVLWLWEWSGGTCIHPDTTLHLVNSAWDEAQIPYMWECYLSSLQVVRWEYCLQVAFPIMDRSCCRLKSPSPLIWSSSNISVTCSTVYYHTMTLQMYSMQLHQCVNYIQPYLASQF